MLGSLGVILDGVLPSLDTLASSNVQADPSALGPIVVAPDPIAEPQAFRVMDLLVQMRLPLFSQIHLAAMAAGWLIMMLVLFIRPLRESKLRGPLVWFTLLILLLGNVFAFAVTIPEAEQNAQQEIADASGRMEQGEYLKELAGEMFFHPRVQNAWVLNIMFLITGFILRATRREYWRNAWKQIRGRRAAMACLAILLVYVAIALLDSVGWYDQTTTEEYDLATAPDGMYLTGEAARVVIEEYPDYTTTRESHVEASVYGLAANEDGTFATSGTAELGPNAPRYLVAEDSHLVVHTVKPAFEASPTTLLDRVLEGQRNREESGYSAPFASMKLQKERLQEWRKTFKVEVPKDAALIQINISDITTNVDGAQIRAYAAMTNPPRVRFVDPKSDYIQDMKRRGLKWDPNLEFPEPRFEVTADWTGAVTADGSALTITREDGKLYEGDLYIMLTAIAPAPEHEDILGRLIQQKLGATEAGTEGESAESSQTQADGGDADADDADGADETVAAGTEPDPTLPGRAKAPFPTSGELQYTLNVAVRTGGADLLPAPGRIAFGAYDPAIIVDVTPGEPVAHSFPAREFTYEALRYPGQHPLGTDQVGSDTLVAGLKGIRTGIIIGGFVTLLAIPFSIFFGTAAGYFGGWVDDVVQYVYSTLASIPGVLLIVAFMLLFEISETRLFELTVILGITSWTGLCRLLRAETLKLREMEYVQAARAFGVPDGRIVMRHVVPNLMHIVLITFILSFSGLVLAEAVLSYIGIGVDPTAGSWGNMINSARGELARDPIVFWSLLGAFILMFTLVLSANLFGDAVRDALDPRLRTR